MEKAYECREVFSPNGKCLMRERSIGAVVPWGVVAVVSVIAGKALGGIPPGLWEFFKK